MNGENTHTYNYLYALEKINKTNKKKTKKHLTTLFFVFTFSSIIW